MPQIRSNLGGTGTETSNGVGNKAVNLSGVCLSRDIVALLETSLLAEKLIQLVALVMVASENLEETGLCTGSTLGTSELELRSNALELLQVHEEILGPGGSSLTNCANLGRLEMCEREGGLVLPLKSERLEVGENLGQLRNKDVESIPHEDKLCVVGDEAACSSVMDDTSGSGSNLSKGMDVLFIISIYGICHYLFISLTAMTSYNYTSQPMSLLHYIIG